MDFNKFFTILCCLVIIVHECETVRNPCVQLHISASSFACVCNSTYCDTIEPDTKLPVGQYALYSSNRAGFRFNKDIGTFTNESKIKATNKITVDTTKTRQTIIGFGGTFTDAAGYNIASLSDGAQKNLIDAYFSPGGIEYTLGRIPIASNDMSEDVYSYDFTNGDTYLSKFTISGVDRTYKIPYIDQAVQASRRNISLYGSPWSAPGWMKSNGDMVGYGTVAVNMSKVYANYLARFMSEYEGFMMHGRMWGLTTQSAPSRCCDPNAKPQYQSMCWHANQTRDWVVIELKQSLIDNGYGHIKLMVMDDNRDQLEEWGEAFDDPRARNAIDGFAVQWYLDTTASPEILSDTHKRFKDKLILASEACVRQQQAVLLGSWERAEEIGRSIFQDMENFVSGFTDYNLAVNVSGGPSWVSNNADSPVIVDKQRDQFYKQPMFYMLGHFSKFVPPDSTAVQVDMQYNSDTIKVAGFRRPDQSVALVIANMGNTDEMIDVTDGNHVMTFNLTQHSVNTLTWWMTG